MLLRLIAVVGVISNLLAGCTYYPDFGPLPNPDLYYIHLKDVVGGIKCAMFGFLYEREVSLGGDTGSFEQKRFELDHTQLASVELTLNTSNSGQIAYSKINAQEIAKELGAGTGQASTLIAIGNSSTGSPFPSASATAKGTNVIVLTLTMAQTVEEVDQVIRDKNGLIVRNKKHQPLSHLAKNYPRDQNWRGYEKFKERCLTPNEDGVVIDYIGLKQWLSHLLSDEESSVWSGAPEVYLDNVALTSTFDIQADLSFGVNHVLRLVPLSATPTLDWKPDHSHQLKITLHGYKNTPSPFKEKLEDTNIAEQTAREKLREQCRRDSGGPCNRPEDLLLEKMIQASSGKRS